MKKCYVIFISFLLLIFQGCSFLEMRTVEVDSYAVGYVPGGTYYLVADNTGLFTLQTEQLSEQLAQLLAQKGYTRVFNQSNAQYIITYQYRVKGPYQGSEIVPVMDQPPWWGPGPLPPPSPSWNQAVQYYTYYLQELFISATGQSGTPIWQVKGSLNTATSDIRGAYPFILEGISSYIDKNSGQVVSVDVQPPSSN